MQGRVATDDEVRKPRGQVRAHRLHKLTHAAEGQRVRLVVDAQRSRPLFKADKVRLHDQAVLMADLDRCPGGLDRAAVWRSAGCVWRRT